MVVDGGDKMVHEFYRHLSGNNDVPNKIHNPRHPSIHMAWLGGGVSENLIAVLITPSWKFNSWFVAVHERNCGYCNIYSTQKETRNVFVPTTHHHPLLSIHHHHDHRHPQKINLCIVFGVQTVIYPVVVVVAVVRWFVGRIVSGCGHVLYT